MRQVGLQSGIVLLSTMLIGICPATLLAAQGPDFGRIASIEVTPAFLTMQVGESANLTARALDDDGNEVEAPILYISRSRRNVSVTDQGAVEAHRPGRYTIVVMVPGGDGQENRNGANPPVQFQVAVTIPLPPLDRIEVGGVPPTLYAGSLVRGRIEVYDTNGSFRPDAQPTFASSDANVIGVDRFGNLTPMAPGTATLRVSAEGVETELPLTVVENPAVSMELASDRESARTGDVIRFRATARDPQGREVDDLPAFYSIQTHPEFDNPAAPASGQIAPDGRFVAELPSQYTVVANAGGLFATATVDIEPRNIQKEIRVAGRAPVRDRHTSDLWVWEGTDGRDFAITGTWRAEGHAYVWDVTDPDNMRMVDRVQVDARTVNDVKVSEDGTLAVISREGASNRRNGIVLLDVSNPNEVVRVSEFDEGLTGGVHNAFIYDNHVYAVNNGRRYDIVNVAEPANPFREARFELDTRAHSIHDVWVEDGIAYSSNWRDGVVLVDVGNGIAGGRADRPVQFASYADPGGATHAAFPFRSESTGRFYVLMGDERFPNGMDPDGPTVAAGYIHVVDFTDSENPVEVARFEVPEAGSHNLWIEDDILYAAFYNGGLRVVDLSGELMGDLYKQGRQIASFHAKDPEGVVSNETMVWGAQPHKGLIYFSDFNSGLWAVELVDGDADED